MERNSFVFYKDWKEAIKDLPDEIRLEIYESIIEYATTGNIPMLKPMANIAFNFIKTTIDRDIEKYMSIVDRNKSNGNKGGRPKYKTQKNPNNPLGFLVTQKNPKNLDSDNVNDSVNDNVNEINNIVSTKVDTLSDNHESSRTNHENINYKDLVNFFNHETKGVFGELRYPISDKRKGHIAARIREHGKQSFIEMIQNANMSDFLKGENNRCFKASFDWMIKPNNYQKIIEGNYENRNKNDRGNNSANQFSESLARNVAEGIARAHHEG